jgi:macrolide transport system ATP-binding/permease protein
MALRSLLHNRMRTALTMLGIIIGVASVVALMAIGNGAKQDVVERIQAMGTDLLTIMRGPPAVRASANIVTSFLPEDLPSIAACRVSPWRFRKRTCLRCCALATRT